MTIREITIALPPRRQARWLGIAVTALLIVVGTRLAPVLLPDRAVPSGSLPAGAPVPPAAVGDQAPAAGATGLVSPDERVAFWEPRVAADPRDYLSALHLADAYADRARATADLADLQRAEAALIRAAAVAPKLLVVARQAQIAFALHEFPRAASLADEVLAESPNDLTALAVAGDALLETGDLARARQHYDRLNILAPSAPVWSRMGRLAFLEADISAAFSLVGRAIQDAEANGFGDEAAFYRYQLGELHRSTGDLAAAGVAYETALDALPGYPAATIGLAMTREAEGRRTEAIALLEAATTRLPTPEAMAALGDLHFLTGDTEAAERAYALVERIGEIARATGAVYDRQLILFAADHDRAVETAISLAESELALRHDIYAWDALAWALYKGDRLDEAAVAANHAMALGTPDPRLAYHAGMIAAARGETDLAQRWLTQALAGAAYLPPLQVPVAEVTLAALSDR